MNLFKKLKLWMKNLIDPRGTTYLDDVAGMDYETKIKRRKNENKSKQR